MITSLGLEGGDYWKYSFQTCIHMYAVCQLFFLKKDFKEYCFQACIHMYAVCQLFFLRKDSKEYCFQVCIHMYAICHFFFLDSLGSVIQCTEFDTMWKLVQSLFYVNIMSSPMHWSTKPNICPFSLTSNSLNGAQGCSKDD